jgi:hypothetical protein
MESVNILLGFKTSPLCPSSYSTYPGGAQQHSGTALNINDGDINTYEMYGGGSATYPWSEGTWSMPIPYGTVVTEIDVTFSTAGAASSEFILSFGRTTLEDSTVASSVSKTTKTYLNPSGSGSLSVTLYTTGSTTQVYLYEVKVFGYLDSGLRVRSSVTGVKRLICWPLGTAVSTPDRLRVVTTKSFFFGGKPIVIPLVSTTDPFATPARIYTSAGVLALAGIT